MLEQWHDYNSKLFDRKDTSVLRDWACDLLSEIDKLRDIEMVRFLIVYYSYFLTVYCA